MHFRPIRFLYRWYTICSAHKEYTNNCTNCNIGRWVFLPWYKIAWRWYKLKFTDRDGNEVNPFPKFLGRSK